MNSTILFGLALGPLFAAIAQVESDNGKTSPNVYQIDAHAGGKYIDDVNQIWRKTCFRCGLVNRPFPSIAKFDRRASERMMVIYWEHWGKHYEKSTGNRVTLEVLARIHNGGPLGWKKRETVRYWNRVKWALEDLEKEGGAK